MTTTTSFPFHLQTIEEPPYRYRPSIAALRKTRPYEKSARHASREFLTVPHMSREIDETI
jgi:hypothetical protein